MSVSKVDDFLKICIYIQCQACWYMPVIPALRRLRQEDHEFENSLSHI
jgi:hypothetical protein